MLMSKLEVLVDFGPKPDEVVLNKTLAELKSQEGVKDAVYKEGAILVETALPSTQVLEMVSKTSGKRAVLQGFGETQSAVAMISSQSCCKIKRQVLGVIRFQQTEEGALVADGSIDGLPAGMHGVHVHTAGDLSQVWDIIGRSVAVTERKDDLGRGCSPSSKIDGDSGTPIACGIIARSAGVFQNPKRICACDGVVVWDERDRPLAGKGRREEKQEKQERRCCQNHSNNANVNPCCKV
ncbi:copper chaperone for superoxide dismutase-like isoform X2 [Spodoptera frugiperda]|uniref:superoxide dismutase n=1 Tax=Spodoptera frugiperda TaxID=7108 RepID=A0A9R0F2G3_SPOFR|nr:copper chaperone for superoxide dismutase-like isoform X2 [Spodoptera frugiperda]